MTQSGHHAGVVPEDAYWVCSYALLNFICQSCMHYHAGQPDSPGNAWLADEIQQCRIMNRGYYSRGGVGTEGGKMCICFNRSSSTETFTHRMEIELLSHTTMTRVCIKIYLAIIMNKRYSWGSDHYYCVLLEGLTKVQLCPLELRPPHRLWGR